MVILIYVGSGIVMAGHNFSKICLNQESKWRPMLMYRLCINMSLRTEAINNLLVAFSDRTAENKLRI
jgi:hypothetical protein